VVKKAQAPIKAKNKISEFYLEKIGGYTHKKTRSKKIKTQFFSI